MSVRDDSGGSGRAKAASRAPASFGAFARKPVERNAVHAAAGPASGIESVQALPDGAVEVGAIVDAYGLKGWVKVAPHAGANRGGDALTSAKSWWIVKGREIKAAPVVAAKTHSDSIVAQLSGVGDRDQALALRGWQVHVRRSDFPSLEADEFYWVDLIGLEVVNEAGVALGAVADLIDNGAHSVLRIEYPSQGKDGQPVTGERLIPFVGVYVKTVDQAAKRIVVDWEADY
ncbi:ribosome maturation factor RimM [Trinickia dinghuensis]|uniref:Ribosome maturation factor RimM n=1 Tax=Trinickia dinghuensis TaxID=2291023 RepID=A0A3D8JWZ4_9BURK|nr:ribosome maturation factor RimM [Trinickia dinghuensis]RDU97154.1 ribosome maturation factor RimM [Trinickia dinghuensis]